MRIYVGAAVIAAVVYVAGLMLPPGLGAAVTGISAIFFLFSVAMIGVELIRGWQADRRRSEFVQDYKRENPNWDR